MSDLIVCGQLRYQLLERAFLESRLPEIMLDTFDVKPDHRKDRICAIDLHTFNSAKVKPLPTLALLLYLMVGHCTTGLNLSTGRGATLAAFARRAVLRRCFRPG